MANSCRVPDPSVLWDVTHGVSGDLCHHVAAQDLHEIVSEITEEAFEVEVDLRQIVYSALDLAVWRGVSGAVREEVRREP